ncbi:MAG: type I 3-dehydroquinate dehydratase [Candidatus Verstraetearchaeota archaeon]|nr:type I 3-dehydroquinate dehydratase [Candidatus Verstraetearchaeota archaeon]
MSMFEDRRGGGGYRYRICASVTGTNESEMARAAIEGEELGADLVELRLDTLEGLDAEKVREVLRMTSSLGIPRIATVMPRSLFGGFTGGPAERGRLILEAADQAEYVDVGAELGTLLPEVLGRATKKAEVVLSWHPERVLTLAEAKKFVEAWPGCSVYKVAMPAKNAEDNIRALELSLALGGVRRIVFCHGRGGKASRILSPLFGAEWVYASLRAGRETAPGQLGIADLRKIREALA